MQKKSQPYQYYTSAKFQNQKPKVILTNQLNDLA